MAQTLAIENPNGVWWLGYFGLLYLKIHEGPTELRRYEAQNRGGM